jgi:16S rRNA (cytidine1402-2'-O)-methyltransferase
MADGTLYLVATPIGNLEDITLRALRILREADIIACEDTRHARILLQRYAIGTRLLSYFGAKEKGKARELIRHLSAGKSVAMISNAGMPGVSDPGYVLVREAVSLGVRVVPVPGANAVLAALAASGLTSDRFVFEGFLPRRRGDRKKRLFDLVGERRTIILYESPRRMAEVLEDARTVLGDRKAVVARELTKLHEEFLRGTLSELIERARGGSLRGEIVIILEGRTEKVDWSTVDIPDYVRMVQEKMGIDKKGAIKLVAHLSGIAKSAVYKRSLDTDR